MGNRITFTKRYLDSLEAREKTYSVSDEKVRGLLIQVSPTGTKSFALKWCRHGRQHWLQLGQYGTKITLEQARGLAREAHGQIAHGGDPGANRREKGKAPTVAKAFDQFIEEHANRKLKARTVALYKTVGKLHVIPMLGKHKVREIGQADIARLHAKMSGTARTANIALSLMSKLLNWCELQGYRDLHTNPCKLVERYPEGRRTARLEDDELSAFGAALDELKTERNVSIDALQAIELLLVTGARRGEILNLEWPMVDWEGKALRLRESKTGAKAIPFNLLAEALLRDLAERNGPLKVFPWRVEPSAIIATVRAWTALKVRWAKKLEREEPPALRIHDLRHVHASLGLSNAGLSIERIGAILGQRTREVTERYAHLAPLESVGDADKIGEVLKAKLGGDR